MTISAAYMHKYHLANLCFGITKHFRIGSFFDLLNSIKEKLESESESVEYLKLLDVTFSLNGYISVMVFFWHIGYSLYSKYSLVCKFVYKCNGLKYFLKWFYRI